ncbi:MAG: hypothetical protein QOI80_2774, partial [Solirubrobacteraceae bacterium]|nr:hypothetical protein [Solirubrobacteraceae bacterium]
MGVLAHHVLLGLSIAALAGAGLRLAGAAGARGLARVLAAATIAFGAAVVEALALGLVVEGGSPLALAGAAGLTWLGARTLIAAAEPAPRHELAAWWDGMGGAGQIAAGVGTALALGLVAWQVRHPYLGLDALIYHLSRPALWVQHGRPGALVDVFPGLPVANYPVTSEVWVGWAVGISRSWVTASVVNVGLAVLAAAGAALGLRAAGASRLAAGLGAGALVALPL